MKRAMMTFGNPFGLALYQKQQREVTSTVAPSPARHAAIPQRDSVGAEPAAEQQLEPLDPATIEKMLTTVLGLPRPALESFTKAFRKRI
jgi:hypothetical protein